eukprot:TRINITY_DN6898_c0_g1_i7.p1 TRINITY_DN6898_c0_g1~~TRINITY_DN6898_c0_g1_i7.p1  ORF type:complete len:413 (+),score=25.02 TRINITY_DN6898_c0_g1_i7:43-1239(+)
MKRAARVFSHPKENKTLDLFLTKQTSDKHSKLLPLTTFSILVSCLGALSFGFHLGSLNGSLSAIAKELNFNGDDFLQGLVVSSCLAGATPGSLIGGVIADSFGRKRALQFNSFPLLIGSIVCGFSHNVWSLIFGRFVIGVGVGLSSALVPLYIGEMSPIHVRGMMGSFNQIGICVGLLAAFILNAVMPGQYWRRFFWLGVVLAMMMGVGMGIISPESPRWLLQFNREKAINLAKKLWGPNGGYEIEPEQDVELSELKKQHDLQEQNILKNLDKHTIRVLCLGCIIFTIQQLSGINAIFYYSSSVFHKVGLKSEALASVGVGLINIMGTLLAAFLIDRMGRKKLLLFSLLVQGTAMIVMAMGLSIQSMQQVSGIIALIGTLVYVLAFAFQLVIQQCTQV